MEENVALDSKKQKQFVKSLKGLKKLMKKTGPITEKPEKETKPIKRDKVTKKKRKERGLVYLSHIPHGFYEHQMTQYFKQFGVVTNVRVIRSKHTGRSKGHAFVEFLDTSVAEIVAETMNNYLMGKRLIKAVYIPPKDQRTRARRMNWNEQNNPANTVRLGMKKAYNADKSENEDLKIATKLLSNLTNTKGKLKELGIDYDFFMPVDVPVGLSDKVIIKEENNEDNKDIIVEKPKKKKVKKVVKDLTEIKDETNESIKSISKQDSVNKDKKNNSKEKKLFKTSEVSDKKSSISTDEAIQTKIVKKSKNIKRESVLKLQVNKKEQKLKKAGEKPSENFIKLSDENGDGDSSYQFDSDEFENMIKNEDSDSYASIDSDVEDRESDVEDPESDLEVLSISDNKNVSAKKNKNKKKKIVMLPIESNKPTAKQLKQPKLQQKRKGPERFAVQSKKPKFEKQSSKKLPNKQIKRK